MVFPALSYSDTNTIETFLGEEILAEYQAMLNGRDPTEVDITRTATSRMTLEPLIFQVAPQLGGCDCEVVIKPYEVYTPHARSLSQIKSGSQVSHAIATFPGDTRLDESLLVSEPILDADNFFVGLYTHEARSDVLSKQSSDDIRKLRFGVGRHWEVDNRVLNTKNLNSVPADGWSSLIQMIINKRSDVTLQPFTATDDLSFLDGDEKFIPIPNVRMRFGEGRSYIVSASHPQGKQFHEALNKGIALLKADGRMREAMIHAGVINPNTDQFRILD